MSRHAVAPEPSVVPPAGTQEAARALLARVGVQVIDDLWQQMLQAGLWRPGIGARGVAYRYLSWVGEHLWVTDARGEQGKTPQPTEEEKCAT